MKKNFENLYESTNNENPCGNTRRGFCYIYRSADFRSGKFAVLIIPVCAERRFDSFAVKVGF